MEKYLVPEPIGEGELSDQWRRFKNEFTQFLTATDKMGSSEQIKLAIFLRIVGPRISDMYETLPFNDGEDRTSWSVVRGKLDTACARRTSKHVVRDKFFQLKQEDKSIDQFVVELRKQSRDCDFGELRDDMIVHVIIRGIKNERIRRRLLEAENLDLPKAIRICQTMEATATDLQSLEGKTETLEKIAVVVPQHKQQNWKQRGNKEGKVGAGAKFKAKEQPQMKAGGGVRSTCSR